MKINILDLRESGTCEFAKFDWRNKLKNEYRGQYDNLKNLYKEIQVASDNKAKIYVLGYPQFIDGSLSANCEDTFNLNSDEREMIVNSVTYFNNVIEQAAKASGVKYIDIETAFGSHRLCDPGDKHVTAITNVFGLNGNEIQESFHPNSKGHKDIADRVKQQISNKTLLTYDACPKTSSTYCPDTSATKDSIESIDYFDITDENTDKKFTYYQLSSGEFVKSMPGNVSALPYTYDPNVGLEVIMYSNPIKLGIIHPKQDGSLDSYIKIPSTAPAGYHTLILKGKSYDGQEIETYQTILVKGVGTKDNDENGILDIMQPCGAFIDAVNEDIDFDGVDDACDPEVTEPIIYKARNGDIEKGEDSSNLYLFRNTLASGVTGITTDYIDKSVDQLNKDALLATSLSTQTKGTFKKLIMLKSTKSPYTKLPTIIARDENNVCIALQATKYSLPALSVNDPRYIPLGLNILSKLPTGVKCE